LYFCVSQFVDVARFFAMQVLLVAFCHPIREVIKMPEVPQRKMSFNGHDSPPTLGVFPPPGEKFITRVIMSNPEWQDCEDGEKEEQEGENNHVLRDK
jgi:hypothetical protein